MSCFYSLLKAVIAILSVIDECGDDLQDLALDGLREELIGLREELEDLTT